MARMSDLASKVTTALGGVEEKPSGPEKQEEPKTQIYRVRKSWEDARSQIGAYRNIGNAKRCADLNPGYVVFDIDGRAIYPEGSTEPDQKEQSEQIHTVEKGDTLWGIARKYLGYGYRYTDIVKLNGLKTSVIYSGQKLKIPRG